MRKFLVILVLFGLIWETNAQKIVTYPVINSIPQNNDFTVKVRVSGGKWIDLQTFKVLVDMHNVQKSSMVNFEFEGPVEVSVKCNTLSVKSARIRPLSYCLVPTIEGDSLSFILTNPVDISVEINEDIFHNLHIFTNSLEKEKPDMKDPNLVYLAPGMHKIDSLYLKSNQSLYLAAGAVLNGKVVCNKVKNVKIFGRGILYQGQRGVEITHSSNVSVEDLIFINPTHYTIFGGQSSSLKIKKIRSFSAKGWADGIDLMSCENVNVDGVFLRTSDDCIALYGHRWKFYGDCRNVRVQNSTLWADVAHPIMVGTHGNPEIGKYEVIENLVFENIDILNHDENQINYQGCMAINVSDENLARNIRYENIRIEDFEQGQLVNLRVTFNKKYATAPGRGIENVMFKDITYNGNKASTSIFEGYSPNRGISNITFDNLKINGKLIYNKMEKPGYVKCADFAHVYEGLFVTDVNFILSSKDENVVLAK